MFGCAHENENAQIKPPIQAKHQSSDHHTHHFTDHPKISISTSTDTSIPQTTNPKNTKPENAHSINHLLLENPKTKLKQKLSTMHTPKPTNLQTTMPKLLIFKPKLKTSDLNNPKGNPITKPT